MTLFEKTKKILIYFLKPFKVIFDLIFLPFRVYFIIWFRKPLFFGIFHAFIVLVFYILFQVLVIKQLPNLDKIENYNPPLETQFFDRNDNLIFKISNEKRIYTKINEIPKNLINALLSAEDKTFFENPGFDIIGTLKILVLDIKKIVKKEKLAGASTITQQLARNLFLSNDRSNFIKLILRKVREITLAYKITKKFDKNKILEIYLNQISLGNNAFGVGAAAEVYFGKKISEINLQESAMLAGLPKGPSYFNPYKNYERAKARRNWILDKMLENKFIQEEECNIAKSLDIELNFERNKNQIARNAAWFAKDLAVEYLKNKNIIHSENELLNNGYKIKLTIDSQIQKVAQKEFDNHLIYLEKYYNEYRPIETEIKFENEEDFKKNWNNKLKKINNEFNEYFEYAFVLDVTHDNILIGLKDGKLGVIPLEKMLWAKKNLKFKCDDILKPMDLIYVQKEDKIPNLNFYENLFKKTILIFSEQKDKDAKLKLKSKKPEKTISEKLEIENFYSLTQIPSLNGGGAITNPKNGEILALIGGFGDIPASFNRAINSNRQIGSTIKPFVYSVALDKIGVKPSDIFMDSDLNFDLGNGVIWNPRNYDRKNRGPLTLRSGIEKSRNAVTIRVMEKTGINRIVKFLEELKFSDKKIEANYSIGIGAVEGSPLSVARAYSIFVNDGKMANLLIISSIKDKNNVELLNEPLYLKENTFLPQKNKNNNQQSIAENESEESEEAEQTQAMSINENNEANNTKLVSNKLNTDESENKDLASIEIKEEKPLISARTAYQMYSFLEGAVKRGSGFGLNELKVPMGTKTGTSDKGRDLWTVAIGNNLCLSIYTGYDIPKDTDMYGVQGAFPVVKNILKDIKPFYAITTKTPPDGLKFIKINLSNGKRTKKPIGKNIIYEVFKKEDNTDEIPEEKEEDEAEDVLSDF